MDETVEANFKHIRDLARNIDERLNQDSAIDRRIRSELAGMFAVTIVATYESIVKETLIEYAGNFHPKYQFHVEGDFAKMNAKISLDNLKSYSRQFGLNSWTEPEAPKNATIFHKLLSERKRVVERRFRKDLSQSYSNLFRWRNDYAHERTAATTFNEVYEAHRVAQYVIRTFVKAFDQG
ncbi:HEPN domain-containing protein [Marimonas sp. MJW-29]|uniref:HEPN domain-containing protein n=1 Tax=Sulfitobacter sediminis TaxID=3234186 RepID=A0ABV3RU09_9RHOB